MAIKYKKKDYDKRNIKDIDAKSTLNESLPRNRVRTGANKVDERNKEFKRSLESYFEIKETSKSILKTKNPDRIKSVTINKRKRKKIENLSLTTISGKGRQNLSYIDFLKDKDNYLKVLKNKTKEIIIKDLETYKKNQNKSQCPMILKIEENELNKFGISINGNSVTGKIPSLVIQERINIIEPVVADDLKCVHEINERVDKIVEAVSNEQEPKEVKGNESSGVGGENKQSPATTTGNNEISAIDTYLSGKLASYLKNTSPESFVMFGKSDRTDQDILSEDLQNFELKGPADIPAYYDFYNLKFAFESIWTEVFDEDIKDRVLELYNEVVRLKDYDGSTIDDNDINQPITSVEELKKFIQTVRIGAITASQMDERLGFVNDNLQLGISLSDWIKVDYETKDLLFNLASESRSKVFQVGEIVTLIPIAMDEGDWNRVSRLVEEERRLRSECTNIIENARSVFIEAVRLSVKPTRLEYLLSDLESKLAREEQYAFKVFAKDSVNFGLLINYRQKWTPLNYQVGDLVGTIPLPPKETRKYNKKISIKQRRNQKEVENSLSILKGETASTSRFESEIVRRANNKVNFSQVSEGSMNLILYDANVTHTLGGENAKDSADTKKNFRESIIKSAHEFKNDFKIEIEDETAAEEETTFTSEIMNPNDEITVTYLLYQLQRRFEVSEKLHKVTPVIFVANNVPAPNEIDEEWLLTHEWILRKVILDDSFMRAFDYLNTDFVSMELTIEILRSNLSKQTAIVEKISQRVGATTEALRLIYERLDRLVDRAAYIQEEQDSEGFFESLGEFLGGQPGEGTDTAESIEANRIRQEGAREMMERLLRESDQLKSPLHQETTALDVANQKYSDAVKDFFIKRVAVDKLRIHIKQNILHYMQAVWGFEPPDQRFFRICDIEVPDFGMEQDGVDGSAITVVRPEIAYSHPFLRDRIYATTTVSGMVHTVAVPLPTPRLKNTYTKLVDIADIDNLLGFKGNYMIFPLKAHNYITDFMIQDFIDETVGGLSDPDEFANYSVDHIKELIKCLQKSNQLTNSKKTVIQDIVKKKIYVFKKG